MHPSFDKAYISFDKASVSFDKASASFDKVSASFDNLNNLVPKAKTWLNITKPGKKEKI
ncbi:MAG: hypothetical protein ABIT08_01510 [Bacteroidia bacterium]